MSTPFEPRDPDGHVEQELRRSLDDHAAQAPDARALTDRLLAAGADARSARGRHGSWNRLGLPLVAAACVAAIVGIVIAVVQAGGNGGGPKVADQHPAPPPVTRTVTPPASPAGTSIPSPSADHSSPVPSGTTGTPPLNGVKVLDLTFTGEDSGWALASADCLSGAGRCTALLRTTDGSSWKSHAGTPFDVAGVGGCPAAKCVTNIRFANDQVGYAFGPDALFLTTDGARNWAKLEGGADALETLDGNVIRVSHSGSCPPGCHYTVQTAAVGSTIWTSRSLPGTDTGGASVQLVRTQRSAYLAALGNTAGGAAARAVLWTSTNDGASWTNRGEPCAQSGGEVDSAGLSPAADGSVTLACRTRSTGRVSVSVLTSGGAATAYSVPVPATSDANAPTPFLAAVSRSTALAGVSTLYRTADGGRSWKAHPSVRLTGGVSFAGFESASVGRLVTGGGTTIWTTRDAGRTWKAVSF